MKSLLIAATLATPLLTGLPAHAADVGVSLQFSQPGVYGRVDIGRYPQPEVVIRQPTVIYRYAGNPRPAEPVYLWVPPAERMHWDRYCGKYRACGEPVYFVRDDWYRNHVRREVRRHDRREDRREDRRDDRHDDHHDDHGPGHGPDRH